LATSINETRVDRTPRVPGCIWLHIDRFDKKSRAVWALQYVVRGRPIYRCATRVDVIVGLGTTRYATDGREPRAYLEFRGRVRWHGRRASIWPELV
jgi:hypothetical protein